MLPRSLLALALLAHAPLALAFPPCPVQPLTLQAVDDTGGVSIAGEPWYLAQYALIGDPSIVDEIKPLHRAPGPGKCRDYDALRIPATHRDDGVVNLDVRYAPVSGFGVVALPDLRDVAQPIQLRHTLDFVVDNTPLKATGDWIDIAELRFQFSAGGNDGSGVGQPSTVYRIRKHNSEPSKTVLEVIQAQGSAANATATMRGNAIARLKMRVERPATRLTLRLSQFKAPTAVGGDIIDPINDPVYSQSAGAPEATSQFGVGAQTEVNDTVIEPLSMHDSLLEVLDADGVVVGQVWLTGQWPSELSMGLLNYNVQAIGDYPSNYRVWLQEMSLRAETF